MSALGYTVEPMSSYYPWTDFYTNTAGQPQTYWRWTWQRDWLWYELRRRRGGVHQQPDSRKDHRDRRRLGQTSDFVRNPVGALREPAHADRERQLAARNACRSPHDSEPWNEETLPARLAP
jgi:hypothetical protein